MPLLTICHLVISESADHEAGSRRLIQIYLHTRITALTKRFTKNQRSLYREYTTKFIILYKFIEICKLINDKI